MKVAKPKEKSHDGTGSGPSCKLPDCDSIPKEHEPTNSSRVVMEGETSPGGDSLSGSTVLSIAERAIDGAEDPALQLDEDSQLTSASTIGSNTSSAKTGLKIVRANGGIVSDVDPHRTTTRSECGDMQLVEEQPPGGLLRELQYANATAKEAQIHSGRIRWHTKETAMKMGSVVAEIKLLRSSMDTLAANQQKTNELLGEQLKSLQRMEAMMKKNATLKKIQIHRAQAEVDAAKAVLDEFMYSNESLSDGADSEQTE